MNLCTQVRTPSTSVALRSIARGRQVRAVVMGALLLVSSGCRERPEPTIPSIVVTVAPGQVSAPDTVRPGWSRLRVEETGGGHIVVVFRLPDETVSSDLPSFLAALDTARMTPEGALALGGPEIGEVGEIVLDLTPGVYVLACLLRGDDGHRHAMAGEVRMVHVAGQRHDAEPPGDAIMLSMRDFIYYTDAPWPAGAQTLHVINDGREDHQLRIDRLDAGVTLNDWLRADDKSTVAEPFAGVARTSPGQAAYLPVLLEPGTYVLYCLIPAARSDAIHAEIGMIRAVVVS